MQCHAGMETWWNDMWGGGGGGKGKGKQQRRRPMGQYRPIYITAPPIYSPQHHVPPPPPPPIFEKPTSYGYGISSFGGHGLGGHGLHSFGGINSGFGGGSISYGGSSIGGLGGFGSGSIQSFAPLKSDISTGHGSSSFNSLPVGHSEVSIVPQPPKVSVTQTIHQSHPNHHSEVSSFGSSYGSSYGPSYGKSTHGFGPIKDDDLIVVSGSGSHEASGGSISSAGISSLEGQNGHSVQLSGEGSIGVTNDITNDLDSSSQKEGRFIDISAPPVYHAGSNSLGDDYAGHSIDGGIASLVQSSQNSKSSEEIIAPFSSPLPMAEHGTSSITYLEEPQAPLYSLSSGADVRSFQPSKQIPFPGQDFDGVIAQNIDIGSLEGQQSTAYSENSQAIVTYDAPLNYNDPIIEIVFEDAQPSYQGQASFEFDPALFQPQSDDVEVYFIEVSDDETYDSIDNLDLSQALAGVKEEFPQGLPSELSQTLLKSGYLDNAQIQVLDLDTALGDDTIDDSLRSALRDAYGSGSNNIATIIKPDDSLQNSNIELRLQRLIQDKNTVKGDAELARTLSKFKDARYGGVVELNDEESEKFLPVTVDGDRIPIPDHIKGKTISGVLVYADTGKDVTTKKTANVVLSTEDNTSTRSARHYQDTRPARQLRTHEWVEGDWKPMPPYVSSDEKKNS